MAHLVIVALICTISVAAVITDWGFPSLPSGNDVGAARFPLIYCGALILLSLILLAQTLARPVLLRSAPAVLILVLCIVGTYAINNSVFDIGIMLAAGIVGYFMQRWDFPASPVVLALIMGPMAEASFRRALSRSNGSYDCLWTRPITTCLLLVALLLPLIRQRKTKLLAAPASPMPAAAPAGRLRHDAHRLRSSGSAAGLGLRGLRFSRARLRRRDAPNRSMLAARLGKTPSRAAPAPARALLPSPIAILGIGW